jgi:hypothetical protein
MLGDQSSNDIGQIVLKVETGEYTKVQVVDHGISRTRTFRVREGKVHERSKKSCAHRVVCVEFHPMSLRFFFDNHHLLSFGEEVPRQTNHRPSRSISRTVFRPDHRPMTVFVFKYTRLGRSQYFLSIYATHTHFPS